MMWVVMALVAVFQVPVTNPRAVIFQCPDHAKDTGHEIDIINAAGVVVQTITAGDPAEDAAGDVEIGFNVQPMGFGSYTVKVRATFGAMRSLDSEPSVVWERVPGKPGAPRVGG
jgi:hypothetical protein